jgi:hypothetical protein
MHAFACENMSYGFRGRDDFDPARARHPSRCMRPHARSARVDAAPHHAAQGLRGIGHLP